MAVPDKTETLLGFALKAKKIILGTDDILSYHRAAYLILIDPSLSENAQKKLIRHGEARNIPVRTVAAPLEDMLHRPGVKAVALTDKNMAAEIIKNAQRIVHGV